MPKTKTHSGLKKRLRITGSGKVRRHKAYSGHLAASKTTKQNRNMRKETGVSATDLKRIKPLISNLM
jgi:large subunit ribosomal protein L35